VGTQTYRGNQAGAELTLPNLRGLEKNARNVGDGCPQRRSAMALVLSTKGAPVARSWANPGL
jgi:hypothetical protein